MALNFPNSPTLNQVYTDSTSGFSYQWNGTVWISFSAASSSQIKTLDDISSGFNNSTQTFALTSGVLSISPPTSQSLIINLGGVIQDATDDYSVSGSNIVFSTAPTNGLSFSGVSLGPAIPINTIPDGTVTDGSLTVAGILSTTNLFVTGVSTFIGLATHTGTIFGNNLSLTGITTIKNASGTVTIGIGTTALLVEGNARVTGILTVGSASITLDGTNNRINIGTGLTLSSSGINVAGVITATSLNVPGLTVIPTPITFSPAIGATSVAVTSNIIITFSQSVAIGTGNITLRSGSAGGTAFSTIGVSSSSVTISGGAVTIDPPSNIGFAVTTFVVVDAGAFSGLSTTSILINTYSFTTTALNLGDSYEGGFLICKASPLRWVVSPRSAEVSRTWYLRNDANTTAQAVSGCTGWFVPTCGQLQNPGYICRSFWGPSPGLSPRYWSSTEFNAGTACYMHFIFGSAGITGKADTLCVRAFRCVTY